MHYKVPLIQKGHLSLSCQGSGLWRQIFFSETTSRVLKATSNQWWPGEVSIVLKGHWFGRPAWQEICVGKVNARTLLSSSPALRVLDQSPQLGCLIVTAPGWVQCTELISLYFPKTFLHSSSRSVLNQLHSPPGWMWYYHLPRKLLIPGFRIRPVWAWSTKRQTPTVPESSSILLPYPILWCNVEEIIIHAHFQESIFGQTYLSDSVRAALSQTFGVFPLGCCTYRIRLVKMKVTADSPFNVL